MSNKIKAGEAYVEVGTKGSLKRGLQRASRDLSAFAGQALRVGATLSTALGGAAVGATVSFVNMASELQKVSEQTGVAVEELSRLQFAAKKLRIDPDDLIGAVEELNNRLGEAVQDGAGPLQGAFEQLGIDANKLAEVPLEQQLSGIAEALNKIDSQAQRAFLADEIFGGDAFKIIPLLNQGAAGIRKLSDEADRLGVTVSTGQAIAATELYDAWVDVTSAVQAAFHAVGKELTPVFIALFDIAKPGLKDIQTLFKDDGPSIMSRGVMQIAKAFAVVQHSMNHVLRAFKFIELGLGSMHLVAVQVLQKFLKVFRQAEKHQLGLLRRLGINVEMTPLADTADFVQTYSDNYRKHLEGVHTDIDELNEIISQGPDLSWAEEFEQRVSDVRKAMDDADRETQRQLAQQRREVESDPIMARIVWDEGTPTLGGNGATGAFNAAAAANIGRTTKSATDTLLEKILKQQVDANKKLGKLGDNRIVWGA